MSAGRPPPSASASQSEASRADDSRSWPPALTILAGCLGDANGATRNMFGERCSWANPEVALAADAVADARGLAYARMVIGMPTLLRFVKCA